MLLDSYYVGNAFSTHEYISKQTKILHYPSPFTFKCAQNVVLYVRTKKATYRPNYFVCTKTEFLSGNQVTRDYSRIIFPSILKCSAPVSAFHYTDVEGGPIWEWVLCLESLAAHKTIPAIFATKWAQAEMFLPWYCLKLFSESLHVLVV